MIHIWGEAAPYVGPNPPMENWARLDSHQRCGCRPKPLFDWALDMINYTNPLGSFQTNPSHPTPRPSHNQIRALAPRLLNPLRQKVLRITQILTLPLRRHLVTMPTLHPHTAQRRSSGKGATARRAPAEAGEGEVCRGDRVACWACGGT